MPFEVPWYYYAILAIAAIFSIIFGILKIYQKKSNLKIEVNKHIDPYKKSPSLQIIVRNMGQRNVILEGATISYRSSFFNFSNLPYAINRAYFPSSTSAYRSFPYPLQAESNFGVLEPYDYIAYSLQQRGISGKVQIKIVFKDATGKEYASPKFIFDMSESKNPSNPIHQSIL